MRKRGLTARFRVWQNEIKMRDIVKKLIVYGRLSIKHKTMMTLLYNKAKKLPEEKKTAEVRAMIDTFNTKVDFVELSALEPIAEEINRGIE